MNIDKMRVAANVVSQVLLKMKDMANVGITTAELDNAAEFYIKKLGAVSYNKGYIHKTITDVPPYPYATCISVNEGIAHCYPNGRKLKSGDLVTIDLGIMIDGVCGDAAMTIGIGEVSKNDQELLKAAKASLMAGIEYVKPGGLLKAASFTIERTAMNNRFTTVKTLAGHRIGEQMHMSPQVLNYFDANQQDVFEVDQVYCIEPILTKKDRLGIHMPGGWEMKTRDGRKAVMFEHMVRCVPGGYEILTSHI